SCHVWDMTSGKELSAFPHTASWNLAFSADGSLLATGEHGSLQIWSVATGKLLHNATANLHRIQALAFSRDRKQLAIGGDSDSDEDQVDIWNVETGKKVRSLKGNSHNVYSVAWSPDGSMLAVSASGKEWRSRGGQQIILWNVAAETIIKQIPAAGVSRVLFSPHGNTIAWESCEESIAFIDATTGKALRPYEAHRGKINTIVYSRDGKLIATGSEDNTVRIWNALTAEPISELRGHHDTVLSVAFSPLAKLLCTGGRDGGVAIWDVASGRQKQALKRHHGYVATVAFSPDGKS